MYDKKQWSWWLKCTQNHWCHQLQTSIHQLSLGGCNPGPRFGSGYPCTGTRIGNSAARDDIKSIHFWESLWITKVFSTARYSNHNIFKSACSIFMTITPSWRECYNVHLTTIVGSTLDVKPLSNWHHFGDITITLGKPLLRHACTISVLFIHY